MTADLARPSEARPYELIGPRGSGAVERLKESWRSRLLVPFFARRFNSKRYARTWLGVTWLFLRPLFMVGSQLILFKGILDVSTGPFPYLVVYLISFIGWNLFSETAYWSTRSLELNRSLLRRLHVPRGTLLFASMAPAVVDAAIIFGFLALTLLGYLIVDGQIELSLSPMTPVYVSIGLALTIAWGQAIGLLLSVPGAQARDVRFGLRYALTFWYFLTPVAYPVSEARGAARTLVDLNPITAPISFLKSGLLGMDLPSTMAVLSSTLFLIPLVAAGALVFFRAEAAALDHI